MTGVVHALTGHDALVGESCAACKAPFEVGQRVVVKPTAPARHEDCVAERA